MSASTIIQSRKYNTIIPNKINSVSLSLATSSDVKEWSHGEVTKPETINYKSYKPERYGLFDEVIFGPQTDFKCPICSTKYKRSNEGQICEKSDECKIFQPEILSSATRRTRMGHIELASPVVHFWFMKVGHSVLAKLLGLKPEGQSKTHSRADIENVVYFKSHIILESGDIKALPQNEIIDINNAAVIYRNALKEILRNHPEDSEAYKDINLTIQELEDTATSKIGKDYGIDFYEINMVIEEYSKAKIGTGAKAMEYLLENFDLKKETSNVKRQITKINKELESQKAVATKIQQRKKLYRRLEVLNGFIASGQDLKSLLIYNLPVIPVDLRPLIQIDGGRHSTTDVNELYRRIIIRNDRLKKWLELDAPILIVQNELRMLQEAVDALIDNARKKPSPVMSKDNRPLKSISDSLSGKKGRFRQNLLGKRVDYSGRSVIVVGPELKMHQAGIPRQMAAKLFEPWIIRELVEEDVVSSIKLAKKLIEEQNPKIWPFVEKAIEGKIVLLNRAPTLHRLSIQSFEPVLVRGKAIKLHPLVTSAFNADFDGDQMAVHVPISKMSILESKELMLANKNILGPKDGEPIINPSQDMILGLYYLTREKQGAQGEGFIFRNFFEMQKAYELGKVHLHARVALPVKNFQKDYLGGKEGYLITTVGKFLFNNSFPTNFPFIFDSSDATLSRIYDKFYAPPGTNIREFIQKLEINLPLNKKNIAKIVRRVFDDYVAAIAKEDLVKVIVSTKFNWSKLLGKLAELKDYKDDPLNPTHSRLLEKLIIQHFNIINKKITLANEGVQRVFELKEKLELLERVWFDYTNVVANSLDNIKDLGFKFSTQSGCTMSISDIKQSEVKAKLVEKGEKYAFDLKHAGKLGLVTDDERYQLVIRNWASIKNEVQKDLVSLVQKYDDNPIVAMMASGARGNISNFVQLAGLRGLMSNNKKILKAQAVNNVIVRSTIEVPIKSSFLEGLTAYEFYSSTPGARKGLTDTALNTANAGYLTRRLVDAAQNIVVRDEDCGTDVGFLVKDIVDTKTGTIIIPLAERIEGRFLFGPIVDESQTVVVQKGEFITPTLSQKIAQHTNKVVIRSILGCQTQNGVCKRCYGKDLSSNRVVQIGEPVGIVAAQSIGEPGTQLTMRTFHTGGVAGVADITGGFDRLKQLIDATQNTWETQAVISTSYGRVSKIEKIKNKIIVYVVTDLEEELSYEIAAGRKIRVSKNTEVHPGKKIAEGPINLHQLLEVGGTITVQNYLLKEVQRLYRMQGISVDDKYVEIIVRQMFSKVLIQSPGDSKFFAGAVVDIGDYRKENIRLMHKGKVPPIAQRQIHGVKNIPLLSDSFLAAASYQETAKVLVHSSISSQEDFLQGLKENIILGHKIPAGTATNYELKGKFDVKDPVTMFKA